MSQGFDWLAVTDVAEGRRFVVRQRMWAHLRLIAILAVICFLGLNALPGMFSDPNGPSARNGVVLAILMVPLAIVTVAMALAAAPRWIAQKPESRFLITPDEFRLETKNRSAYPDAIPRGDSTTLHDGAPYARGMLKSAANDAVWLNARGHQVFLAVNLKIAQALRDAAGRPGVAA